MSVNLANRPRVVLTDYVWDSLSTEHDILDPHADITVHNTADLSEIRDDLRRCDALLNTYAGPISEEIIGDMDACKIIARYGIGVDTIDVAAATRAGIIVTNNPTYCIAEVAEHALALMMALVRKIAVYDRDVRAGRWALGPGKPMRQLEGSTLGLIGFGNIARALARRAEGLGMRVLFHDPYVDEAADGLAARPAALDELLSRSDIVSLHPPLNDATRGMIGADQLAAMRSDAFLVNVSRGPLVRTDDLVAALREGKIAGAGLDATDPEPLPESHPLRELQNVIVTPHAAWYSEEAIALLQKGAPSEIARVLSGAKPTHIVNPEVLGRCRAEIG